MTLTRNAKTALISVHSPEFMAFQHRRGHPCPLFFWDGSEPLELHHLGAPDARGFWMRKENDGLTILIPRSVHANSQHWEAEGGGRLFAAAVAYALADFLAWLVDPADDEPRAGDPLVLIVQASLTLAQREREGLDLLAAWRKCREAEQALADEARHGVRPASSAAEHQAALDDAGREAERAELALLRLLHERGV